MAHQNALRFSHFQQVRKVQTLIESSTRPRHRLKWPMHIRSKAICSLI